MDVFQGLSSASKLADVVRALSWDAQNTLVRLLRDQGSLKATRLLCRDLRMTVDGAITRLTLELHAGDKERWATGNIFPLNRWPALWYLDVNVGEYPALDSVESGDHLALPFLGQPPKSVERIRLLRLHGSPAAVVPAFALSSLLPSFQGLQILELGITWLPEPLQQHLLFSTLASLPVFRSLQLPSCRYLDRITLLADKLKYLMLELDPFAETLNVDLLIQDGAALAALSQLSALEDLNIHLSHDQSGQIEVLRALLDNLPPNLKRMVLPECGLLDQDMKPYVDISLEAGHITDITVQDGLYLESCDLLFNQVLMCSRALGPALSKLFIETLYIHESCLVNSSPSSLRPLLQLCDAVDVPCICFRSSFETESMLQVYDLFSQKLQNPVKNIMLDVMEGDHAGLTLHMCRRLKHPHGCNRIDRGANACFIDAAANGDLTTPVASAILDETLSLMASTAAAGVVTRCLRQGGNDGKEEKGQMHLVLLSGPLVNALGWAPAALHAWMEQLAVRVGCPEALTADGTTTAAAAAADCVTTDGAEDVSSHVTGYLLLPHSPAVVVECRTAAAAAALRTVALSAQMRAGAPDSAALQLEVTSLAMSVDEDWPSAGLVDVVVLAINKVVQSHWDAALNVAGSINERHNLHWVFEFWQQASALLEGYRSLSIAPAELEPASED